MQNGKFDPMLVAMENSLQTIKGEVYEFTAKGRKKAALNIRKALLNISKVAKQMRDEVQKTKTALPVRRRTKKEDVQAATA